MLTKRDRQMLLNYGIEGVVTALAVAFICLIAVGPKSFGESAILVLLMSFWSAGVAMGCTKLLFEEVMKYYESSHKKDAD
jgi:hypothetical protein